MLKARPASQIDKSKSYIFKLSFIICLLYNILRKVKMQLHNVLNSFIMHFIEVSLTSAFVIFCH